MRKELLYLKDAIVHTERAISYVESGNVHDLPDDQMRLDAVLRNLQIVGEAVKQMPIELRSIRPDIPWSKIAGIRNLLVHHYFQVDNDIIVDLCEQHLVPLLVALKEIQSAVHDDDGTSS